MALNSNNELVEHTDHYDSLESAKDKCIEFGASCNGVTKSPAGFFTLKSGTGFSNSFYGEDSYLKKSCLESNPFRIWGPPRDDFKCGYKNKADCSGSYPCCSPHGWCGSTEAHCNQAESTNFSQLTKTTPSKKKKRVDCIQ